jgi:hypothetical protein
MRRAVFGLLLGSSLASPTLAATPFWTISEASQGVMVSHAGLVKAALRGGRAEPGDIITTSANARAVLVRGEEYAVVAPNSRLQVSDPAESSGITQFIEKVGNVVFSIKKMATPHFGVQTPYLAAVVKGTTFSVTVDDSGASVQVVEGAVEVATKDGGARELLHPGAIASVGASDLGALTIQGTTTRTIRSNSPVGAPVGKASVVASAASITEVSDTAAVSSIAAPASAKTSVASVEEASTDLSALSSGLVSGQNGTQIALASTTSTGADAAVAAATEKSTSAASGSNGKSSGSNSGKGSNSGSNGSGNSGSGSGKGSGSSGSGNGGGNGSGNNGNGNGNGGGNGSGNNGNGNGNGGGNGSGNNGNGNGNGGGNGSGNNGNGNGNGGGNGSGNNGNGNGNGGGNGSGNNGNGNGNGGGNGSGNNGNGNGNGKGGKG